MNPEKLLLRDGWKKIRRSSIAAVSFTATLYLLHMIKRRFGVVAWIF
jgi:hypothetical protein